MQAWRLWSPILAAVCLASLARPGLCEDALPPGDEPPPTVFSRLEDAGTSDDHPGADEVIVYDRSVNRVRPSGVTYVESYTIRKVLTPAGCRDLSVLSWRYEPWSSYIELREVNVVRDGERIPVDVSGVRDLPAPQSGIYWNSRVQSLQLPRLEVGDGIEIRAFRKGYSYALLEDESAGSPASGNETDDPTAPHEESGGSGATEEESSGSSTSGEGAAASAAPDDEKYIPPMPGEYFDIVLFQASVPIIERRYVLALPADKRLHSEVYNGPLYSSTTYGPDTTKYAWWAVDVPGRPGEPRAAAASDVVPKVVVATVESWEAKSRWFFDVNRNQFEVTPEIQAKVDEILAEAGLSGASEEEKAEELVHWVAQNIRYSGQTMGEGEGFTLHSGAMIFEQRSGVCKDIAGMLVTMMRAAGMDSYAAMTMAGSRIEETPADQFNHCVTALRRDDGTFEMYDPTWVPYYNEIWSKYETEQQYLIGTPEGKGLRTIPYSPPEESPLRVSHEARIDESGTLTGSFRLDGAGAMDSRLRNMVSYDRIADVPDYIAGSLSVLSDRVEVTRLEHIRPDDFSSDAWIEIDYRVPEYAFPAAEGLEFRSPMATLTLENGWLCRACVYGWGEERSEDVFLWFTQLIEGEETIRIPSGYGLARDPEPEEVDETYAYFDGSAEVDGGRLSVTERFEVRRRQIPPDGYEGFRTAVDEATGFSEFVYRIEKGGEK
ncbi:MAG: DUF3857 domain-containing protein [Candidatus Eisenbacteria bacterium]|nr:DUF3857 domain-containing protein [Candidatus Eisenbacteria bacterium]